MTSFPKSPLTQQVQELFLDSALSPVVTALLVRHLDAMFVEQTLAYSSDLPAVIDELYAIDDQQMYVVVSVCNVNEYKAVLLPLLRPIIKKAAVPVLEYLKDSELYSGVALYAEIKKLNDLTNLVFDLLTISTKTKRRAIGNAEIPNIVTFPEYDVLKKFYECGRKKAYISEDEGTVLHGENTVYLCKHCKQYHQGRTRIADAPVVPETIMLSRYQTAWRRYYKI